MPTKIPTCGLSGPRSDQSADCATKLFLHSHPKTLALNSPFSPTVPFCLFMPPHKQAGSTAVGQAGSNLCTERSRVGRRRDPFCSANWRRQRAARILDIMQFRTTEPSSPIAQFPPAISRAWQPIPRMLSPGRRETIRPPWKKRTGLVIAPPPPLRVRKSHPPSPRNCLELDSADLTSACQKRRCRSSCCLVHFFSC